MSVLKLAYLASWLSFFLTYSQGVLAFESHFRRDATVASATPSDSLILSSHPQKIIQEKTEKNSVSSLKTISNSDAYLCDLLSELDNTSQTETRSQDSSQPIVNRVSTENRLNFRQKILNSWQNWFRWSANAAQASSPILKPVITLVTVVNSDQNQVNQEIITKQNILQSFWKIAPTTQETDTNQSVQLLVNEHLIGIIPNQAKAKIIARRLESILSEPHFDPLKLKPTIVEGLAGGKFDQRVLFVLDETIIPQTLKNPDLLAIKWINNLRIALKAAPLDLVEAQQEMYGLVESEQSIKGLASWYGPYFHGRVTANGEIYNQHGITAAHPSLKLNTYLKVTNLDNNRSIILRVNDRGPYIPPRSLDLSLGAAECLDSVEDGVIPYQAVVMKPL